MERKRCGKYYDKYLTSPVRYNASDLHCIGNGGYPCRKMSWGNAESEVADLRWVEEDVRFSARPDVGNNGFCALDMAPDHVTLTYWDWWRRARRTDKFNVIGGGLEIDVS